MNIIDTGYFWTEASQFRNELTRKYEPVQPFFLHALSETLNARYFFDVGSNVGYYTAFMSLLPGLSRIHAFEASPETFAHLEANVGLNNLQGKVDLSIKAVSDKRGTVRFQIGAPLAGINSIADTSIHNASLYKKTLEVECCSLDSIQNYSGEIIALKIDVEGHEAKVLAGANALLRDNICIIQVESSGNAEYQTIDALNATGYKQICRLGNNIYFSNAPVLLDKAVVLENLQRAVGNHISDNIGAWQKKTRASIVKASVKVSDGKVRVSLDYDRNIFSSETEFAFYVFQNGSRVTTQWYSERNLIEYVLGKDVLPGSIRLCGFVREKRKPEKKAILMIDVPAR